MVKVRQSIVISSSQDKFSTPNTQLGSINDGWEMGERFIMQDSYSVRITVRTSPN
jgi:hypothetical protein